MDAKKHYAVRELELVKAIKAALDCPNHFYSPKIKNPPKATFKPHKEECFTYGKEAIVICGQCVNRLKEVIEDKNETLQTT